MTEPPLGGFLITSRDVYDQLVKLTHAVQAMEPNTEKLTDHEARLRSVERWRYALPASMASMASVLTAILAAIIEHK
jgi:predicted NAD/FAD-dependent oxidoreductase